MFLTFFVPALMLAAQINANAVTQRNFVADDSTLHWQEKLDKLNAAVEYFRVRWDMQQMRLESQSEMLTWLNQKVDLLLKSNPQTACFQIPLMQVQTPDIDIRGDLATNSTNFDPMTQENCEVATKTLPHNCQEATMSHKKSDIYKIRTSSQLANYKEFYVPCEAEIQGGGWTVVLRRKDGSIDFYRDWHTYELGFGNLDGEFFIGLKKLHELTNDSLQELLIVMEDFEKDVRYAKYDSFAIGTPEELYAINVLGKYSGNAGDSLRVHEGQPFSSHDADHDRSEKWNCASLYTGGWWHRECHESNLMGQYLKGGPNKDFYGKGVVWKAFREVNYSLKFVQMMIRPKKSN